MSFPKKYIGSGEDVVLTPSSQDEDSCPCHDEASTLEELNSLITLLE